jgi:transposase
VCGFALKRFLEAEGLPCKVIAPSLVPVKPGQRIKTNRRDAKKLAELLAAGLLTEVFPPTEAQEAARSLYRCRDAVRQDLMRARQRLGKFLLRQGRTYRGGRHWTQKHGVWLRGVEFSEPLDQEVYSYYLADVAHRTGRLAELDSRLAELSGQEPYREPVGWLRCFRGVDTLAAMTIVTELFGFRRFGSPRQLMSYLGMTPSEHSSMKTRRGGITKTGNRRVRRVLVEISWHYRHRPGIGVTLRKRRSGQPAWVVAVADRAQERLCRRFRRLLYRGVLPNKAATAVGRELVGFLWSVLIRSEAMCGCEGPGEEGAAKG